MNNYKKNMVAIAVGLGLSMSVAAEEVVKEATNAEADAEIEQIVIVGKRKTYSNNSAGQEQKRGCLLLLV